MRFTSSIVLVAYLNLAFPVGPLLAATSQATNDDPPLVRTPTRITVNRTPVPNVLPQKATVFSAQPTPEEIFQTRVLAEPFVPMLPVPPRAENAALAKAIQRYLSSGATDLAPFTEFLASYPHSVWAPSVNLNLGLRWFSTGAFSKAIAAYRAAWEQAKSSEDPRGR